MPYIVEDRRHISNYIEVAETAGELNYLFTQICNDYLDTHGLDYQHINDCIGALEGVKLELYRRLAVPYEDKKKKENGDVYWENLLEE